MANENEQDIKINSLEINQQNMAEKIDDLKKTVITGFQDLKEDLTCFRNEADRKYASKTTETLVYGMVAIILTAFIGGVVFLVWK